jgi:hypothetical protein
MTLVFRDPDGFFQEALAVTVGATATGAVVGLAGASAPLVAAAGAAALFGGSVGAALTRSTPPGVVPRVALRSMLGSAAGVLAGVGFAALSWRLGLGDAGTIAGGALGGAALGALLGIDEPGRARRAQLTGMFAAAAAGAVGAAALDNAALFAHGEQVPAALSTATLAGLMGLWIAAGAGARRLQPQKDPLSQKADDVLQGLADPVRSKVVEGLSTWTEIDDALVRDAAMADETKAETTKQTRSLVDGLLETARTWGQIHHDLHAPRAKAVGDKLNDLQARLQSTTDDVTRGHLARALTALQAQQAAIDGLKTGMGRAEAAIDAQLALLERLRLAVAQHRVSDRERFFVELTAVAEQAGRLSDDLDALSSAVAEAEALADRRALADIERGARRALTLVPGEDVNDRNSAPVTSAAPVAAVAAVAEAAKPSRR